MHREFSAALRGMIAQFSRQRDCAAIDIDPVVQPCPYPEDGDIASPVVFELARSFPGSKPQRLAEELVRLHEATVSARFFEIQIAGGGYLNARVTSQFIQSYIDILGASGQNIALLFSPQSFVVRAETDLPVLSKFGAQWSRLWEVAATSEADDVSAFAEFHKSSSRKDEQLMLLALLGDKELEADPFLKGLAGRQNVPWYIKQFFQDAERAEALWRHDIPMKWERDCSETWSFTEQLLNTRRMLLRAAHRPDDGAVVAIQAALLLIRQFYNYFNNPRYRLDGENAASRRELYLNTLLTREIVRLVLRLVPIG